MAQEWAKAFYSSTLWVKTRGYILKRDRYVCQRCGRPATVVHHKVHLTKDNIKNKNISLGPANLESLCDDCHRIEHEEERRRFNLSAEQKEIRRLVKPDYVFDSNGNIVPRSSCPPGVVEFKTPTSGPTPTLLSN